MIVGILLLVVAIINIMEAFRKQKNKLIFRTCNYLVFPVVYLICCLFNIFGWYDNCDNRKVVVFVYYKK